jgi:hypothetical protein
MDGGTVATDSLWISRGCDETRVGRPWPRGGLAEAIRILSDPIEVLDERIVRASEIPMRKTIDRQIRNLSPIVLRLPIAESHD